MSNNEMDKATLFDALNGLKAYDDGVRDSGIRDEILRQKVKDYILSLDENTFRLLLTEYIRTYFVSERAVEQGYGIEDVRSFINWMSHEMDIDI